MSKRKGFTLVELLVVMSIIAMLISILLPALAKARHAARDVMCKAQLKKFGMINLLWVEDHDGYGLPGDWYENTEVAELTGCILIENQSSTYSPDVFERNAKIEGNTFYRCPDDNRVDFAYKKISSYGMNILLTPYELRIGGIQSRSKYVKSKLDNLRNKSQNIFMMDHENVLIEPGINFCPDLKFNQLFFPANTRWHRKKEGYYRKANLLMLDGHVVSETNEFFDNKNWVIPFIPQI